MNDSDIVNLFWARNEDAISESKKGYETYCLYIAQNLLNDRQDSEETLNDVLLAAWKSIPPQRPNNLKTYLGKLTREIAVDRLRKNGAKKRVPNEEISSLDELEELIGAYDVEQAVTESELSSLLSAFLRSIREDDRTIFIRRYWHYDSVKTICAKYGFGQSKVLVSLKRTRDKLALYLKKEGYLT